MCLAILKCKSILKDVGCDEKNEKVLIATIFGILVLQNQFVDKKSEWTMSVDKAMEFCVENVKDQQKLRLEIF